MKTTLSANLMTNSPPASGLSFTEQEELIERIATAKAYQHRKIGYYDFDDLKQEVRVKCWKAVEKYNESCGANLFVFLSICAENRLRDIRRSVQYKNNKPCFRCPFWDKGAAASGNHDCLVYYDKINCERYAKHERFVYTKLSASSPIDIDTQRIEDNGFGSHLKKLEIVEIIESRLPPYLGPIFQKFKAHNFNIKILKPKERKLLIATLRDIVDETDFH